METSLSSSGRSITVGVAGATGFIGRHVVSALLSRGHAVRALVRRPAQAGKVLGEHPGLSLHEGDASDGTGLAEWARGAGAIVNAIGIIREATGGQTFSRVHVGVCRHLVSAAKQGGVGRLVLISALGVSDESDSAYGRSKFEGEMLVRNSGLAWTILRPSLVHGGDGEFSRMAASWARGRAAPFLFMPYFSRPVLPIKPPVPKFEAPTVAPIHVDDVALAVVRSLEVEAAVGEVVNLCGPERLTWPEMLTFIRDGVKNGKKELRVVGIPGPVAAMQARAAKLVGLRDALPFDEGMATMGCKDSVCSMERAGAILGVSPAGYRQSAAGYLGSL